MGHRSIRRRLERIEARIDKLEADSLAGVSEFRFVWVESLPENTPVPPGSRRQRRVSLSGPVADWRRPGVTFRYGTSRDELVAGGEESEAAGEKPLPPKTNDRTTGKDSN